MISTLQRSQPAPPIQFSCEMAETRRWDVTAPSRRVRDLTWERRIASAGLGAASAMEESARSAKTREEIDGMCIVVTDLSCKSLSQAANLSSLR